MHILPPVFKNQPRNESKWQDQVSNPGTLVFQSDTLPIALSAFDTIGNPENLENLYIVPTKKDVCKPFSSDYLELVD